MAVLGLRRKPGLIALTVFRSMPLAYRLHLGRLFGHTFLNLTHRGRKSGRLYRTALKTVAWDRATGEVIVFSMYGMDADWMKNITASPVVAIEMAGKRFEPEQRLLTLDEAFQATARFRRAHPRQMRLFSTVLGWGRLNDEDSIRDFVRTRPFIALRPATAQTPEPLPPA
jgi:deazaflavin-dependent oxidoreductase (nitroreductase family)